MQVDVCVLDFGGELIHNFLYRWQVKVSVQALGVLGFGLHIARAALVCFKRVFASLSFNGLSLFHLWNITLLRLLYNLVASVEGFGVAFCV